MIYYRCFICGAPMDSPSCLIGRTEKCPECGTLNWVPHGSTVRRRAAWAQCLPWLVLRRVRGMRASRAS